jgi:hypothetical protein
MRALLFTVALAAAGCQDPVPTMFTTGGADLPAEAGKTYRWTFDDAPAGAPPAGLINVLGVWTVAADEGTQVLRQSGEFGDPDFPRIVVSDLTFQDHTVRVRCRLESGGTDRACGLMFRLVDSENYYITRANALEDNVRLYRVVDGDRQQIASAGASIGSGVWHTLEATARGDQLTVTWDGKLTITRTDTTFQRGKIGLWTKADAVTAFDDVEATAD